jgi:hypothetical protein
LADLAAGGRLEKGIQLRYISRTNKIRNTTAGFASNPIALR